MLRGEATVLGDAASDLELFLTDVLATRPDPTPLRAPPSLACSLPPGVRQHVARLGPPSPVEPHGSQAMVAHLLGRLWRSEVQYHSRTSSSAIHRSSRPQSPGVCHQRFAVWRGAGR